MKFMLVWRIPPGNYKPAIEGFLRAGAPRPSGLKTLGRWHTPGSTMGWLLVEANDLTAVAEHVAEWANLCEIVTYPVIDDAEAKNAASRALGN